MEIPHLRGSNTSDFRLFDTDASHSAKIHTKVGATNSVGLGLNCANGKFQHLLPDKKSVSEG